jgi:hypothetical protein
MSYYSDSETVSEGHIPSETWVVPDEYFGLGSTFENGRTASAAKAER